MLLAKDNLAKPKALIYLEDSRACGKNFGGTILAIGNNGKFKLLAK